MSPSGFISLPFRYFWVSLASVRVLLSNQYAANALVCVTCVRVLLSNQYAANALVCVTCVRVLLSNQYAANALVCVTCRNYLTIYHMQELFDCGDITCDGDALESAQVYVAVALFPHAARFLMATLQ